MRVILTAAACLAPVLAALKLSLPLPSVWALPVAAALLALVIGTLNARQIVSTALGALMLTVATHQADAASASVAVDPDSTSWPTYDLTNGPLPDDASGFVNVSGFLRPSLKIREFQVEGTQRPDQNEAAHAALMPWWDHARASSRSTVGSSSRESLTQAAPPPRSRSSAESSSRSPRGSTRSSCAPRPRMQVSSSRRSCSTPGAPRAPEETSSSSVSCSRSRSCSFAPFATTTPSRRSPDLGAQERSRSGTSRSGPLHDERQRP